MTTAAFSLRRAEPEDAEAMFAIMKAALAGPATSVSHIFASAEHEIKWLRYLTSEGRGSWVANTDGRLIGFSAGCVRGLIGWLALLCVEPAYQGLGCGRALLSRAVDDLSSRATLLATLVDGATPKPLNMYLGYGLIPVQAFLALHGPVADGLPDPGTMPQARRDPGGVPFDAMEDQWMHRPGIDHSAYFQQAGFEFRSFWGESGSCQGFAYWTSSGRLGPVLAAQAEDVPRLLAGALAEMAATGLHDTRVLVPSANRGALRWLSERGFRVEGTEIACATGPLPGAWDRYIAHRAALP